MIDFLGRSSFRDVVCDKVITSPTHCDKVVLSMKNLHFD